LGEAKLMPKKKKQRCWMCKREKLPEEDDFLVAPTHLFLFNEPSDRRCFTTAPNYFCAECFAIWTTEMDNARTRFQQPDFPKGKFVLHLVRKGRRRRMESSVFLLEDEDA